MGNCTGVQKNDVHNETGTNSKLLIKTSTWVRDSHELFDYESQHLVKKTFKVHNHINAIQRHENEVSLISEDLAQQGNSNHSKTSKKSPKAITHVDSSQAYQLQVEDEAKVFTRLEHQPVTFITQHQGQFTLFDLPHQYNQHTQQSLVLKKSEVSKFQQLLRAHATLTSHQGLEEIKQHSKRDAEDQVKKQKELLNQLKEQWKKYQSLSQSDKFGLLEQQSNAELQCEMNQDQNRLWLIVRYLSVENRTNEYQLRGGETIKLGRVKFTVREVSVSNEEDENQTDYQEGDEEELENEQEEEMDIQIAQAREQSLRDVNIMRAHSSRQGNSGAIEREYASRQRAQIRDGEMAQQDREAGRNDLPLQGGRVIGERINNNIAQVSRDSIEDYQSLEDRIMSQQEQEELEEEEKVELLVHSESLANKQFLSTTQQNLPNLHHFYPAHYHHHSVERFEMGHLIKEHPVAAGGTGGRNSEMNFLQVSGGQGPNSNRLASRSHHFDLRGNQGLQQYKDDLICLSSEEQKIRDSLLGFDPNQEFHGSQGIDVDSIDMNLNLHPAISSNERVVDLGALNTQHPHQVQMQTQFQTLMHSLHEGLSRSQVQLQEGSNFLRDDLLIEEDMIVNKQRLTQGMRQEDQISLEDQLLHKEIEVQSCASQRDIEELHKTMYSNSKESEKDQSLCRICFSEFFTSDNPLISPCKCSGSMKHIHLECLRTWLSRKENVKTSQHVVSYSWRAFNCELCKTEYNDKIRAGGKMHWLFEMQKPKSNYIVLESIQLMPTNPGQQNVTQYNTQSKTLHILSFNQKQILKIGRGHDNDLRVADISVSRCHAFIKRDPKNGGSLVLEDNQSKFGTLVMIKAPLVLLPDSTYYIQAGRTIMKLNVQPEWSLFGGIMKPSHPQQPKMRQHVSVSRHRQNQSEAQQSSQVFRNSQITVQSATRRSNLNTAQTQVNITNPMFQSPQQRQNLQIEERKRDSNNPFEVNLDATQALSLTQARRAVPRGRSSLAKFEESKDRRGKSLGGRKSLPQLGEDESVLENDPFQWQIGKYCNSEALSQLRGFASEILVLSEYRNYIRFVEQQNDISLFDLSPGDLIPNKQDQGGDLRTQIQIDDQSFSENIPEEIENSQDLIISDQFTTQISPSKHLNSKVNDIGQNSIYNPSSLSTPVRHAISPGKVQDVKSSNYQIKLTKLKHQYKHAKISLTSPEKMHSQSKVGGYSSPNLHLKSEDKFCQGSQIGEEQKEFYYITSPDYNTKLRGDNQEKESSDIQQTLRGSKNVQTIQSNEEDNNISNLMMQLGVVKRDKVGSMLDLNFRSSNSSKNMKPSIRNNQQPSIPSFEQGRKSPNIFKINSSNNIRTPPNALVSGINAQKDSYRNSKHSSVSKNHNQIKNNQKQSPPTIHKSKRQAPKSSRVVQLDLSSSYPLNNFSSSNNLSATNKLTVGNCSSALNHDQNTRNAVQDFQDRIGIRMQKLVYGNLSFSQHEKSSSPRRLSNQNQQKFRKNQDFGIGKIVECDKQILRATKFGSNSSVGNGTISRSLNASNKSSINVGLQPKGHQNDQVESTTEQYRYPLSSIKKPQVHSSTLYGMASGQITLSDEQSNQQNQEFSGYAPQNIQMASYPTQNQAESYIIQVSPYRNAQNSSGGAISPQTSSIYSNSLTLKKTHAKGFTELQTIKESSGQDSLKSNKALGSYQIHNQHIKPSNQNKKVNQSSQGATPQSQLKIQRANGSNNNSSKSSSQLQMINQSDYNFSKRK